MHTRTYIHTSTQLSVTQNISLHSVSTLYTPPVAPPSPSLFVDALIPMQYQALFNFLSATMMHDQGKTGYKPRDVTFWNLRCQGEKDRAKAIKQRIRV